MTVAERREREREERRNWILDAAMRVFYEKGIDAAKMKDVAEAAQLGKGTLYLYFRTKDALILGVALRHQTKLLARFDSLEAEASDGLSLLRSLASAYADHMSEPREHLRMVLGRWASGQPLPFESRGGDQMRENLVRLRQTLCGAIERGQADGTIRADLDVPRIALSLIAAVNGALLMQMQLACMAHGKFFPEQVPPTVHESIDFYLEALSTGRARLAEAVGGP